MSFFLGLLISTTQDKNTTIIEQRWTIDEQRIELASRIETLTFAESRIATLEPESKTRVAQATELASAYATIDRMKATGQGTGVSVTMVPDTIATHSYFRLINRHTQMCLTAQGGSGPVVQASCGDGRDDQVWYLPEGVTQVALQSKSNVCVGYDPSNTSNTLFQIGCSGSRPWMLVAMGTYYQVSNPLPLPHGSPTTVPKELVMYYLIQYQGDCADVENWKHDEGGSVIHYNCRTSDNDNQLWARF